LFDDRLLAAFGQFEGDSSQDFAAAGGQRRSEGVQMRDSRLRRFVQPQSRRKLWMNLGSRTRVLFFAGMTRLKTLPSRMRGVKRDASSLQGEKNENCP
jgi:hypothetical protein